MNTHFAGVAEKRISYPPAGGTFGFLCLFIVFFQEDRHKTEILYLSLPLKRETIVGARYLLAGLMSLAGGATMLGLSCSLDRLFPSSGLPGRNVRQLLSLEGTAFVLVVSVFFIALYLREF